METFLQKRSGQMFVYCLFWLFFSLYFTSETYIYYQTQTTSVYSFWFMFLLIAPEGIAWIPLGLIVIAAARRFPVSRPKWKSVITIHLLLSVAIALLHSVIHAYLAGLFGVCQQMPAFIGRPFDLSEHILFNLTLRFHRNILTYFAILGISQGAQYYIAYRDRQLKTSILETQLAEARLQALRLQLQPHFLFNTMHTISSLVHVDPDTAQKMIVRLSELLRMTLKGIDVQEHTLNEEIALVDKYLEIEKIRFEDKLRISFTIDDNVRQHKVPNLILQPLVENSIKHGIERSSSNGTIEISSRKNDRSVIIEIKNSGTLKENLKNILGIGISSTKARLEQLYGKHSAFRLFEHDGFSIAEIIIPIRS